MQLNDCLQQFFNALGVHHNYLQQFNTEKSLIFSGAYETSHDISPLIKSLCLHCKRINITKSDWAIKDCQRPQRLSACMKFSDYKVVLTLMLPVFL